MEIYQPAEDSYFLSRILINYLSNKSKKIKILDMGSGSGVQAKTCKRLGFSSILTADINKEAIKNLKKQGFKSIHSDLFSNLKKQKFDLIIFNPPYLPEHKYDKEKDTTGGKKGFETIIKFLKQAKNNLEKNGEILLLFSSLSKPKIIKKQAEISGYKLKELSSKKLFFEEIFIYKIFL